MFEIENNVSLKDFCTFHIGGKAKFLFVAKDTPSLINVCLFAKAHNIKYKIIGLGANLLFDDLGYDGLIIVNKTNEILFRKKAIYCSSGVNVTNLIMKCYMRSLCGFERLAGIPSTVGGAVVNSLGAFETNFSDFVEYVECYHKSDLTKKLKLTHSQCQFGYRTSLFKSGEYIITRVKLKLNEENKNLIKARIDEAINKKKSTQPLDYPSAGSVFKRGNIIPAKVIDELGLKGTKIGGAEISTKHAGFIVNTNSATSKDVKDLIKLIQDKVKTATNEHLDPEIEFVEY
ncbi:MAG: UDP-N-acetylmuramate dehydrogenase [Clostridia bacterium]|nr:UDP-N-acetylmuramate dehydrogenase [Clostridia bacterium]